MALSFFQFIILLLLLFLMFGDIKTLSNNITKVTTFFNSKPKDQEKRDLNP